MEQYKYVRNKTPSKSIIIHSGIKGQKWGERRFQNEDGTLTAEGRIRYGVGTSREDHKSYERSEKRSYADSKYRLQNQQKQQQIRFKQKLKQAKQENKLKNSNAKFKNKLERATMKSDYEGQKSLIKQEGQNKIDLQKEKNAGEVAARKETRKTVVRSVLLGALGAAAVTGIIMSAKKHMNDSNNDTTKTVARLAAKTEKFKANSLYETAVAKYENENVSDANGYGRWSFKKDQMKEDNKATERREKQQKEDKEKQDAERKEERKQKQLDKINLQLAKLKSKGVDGRSKEARKLKNKAEEINNNSSANAEANVNVNTNGKGRGGKTSKVMQAIQNIISITVAGDGSKAAMEETQEAISTIDTSNKKK